jgi:hypothetical protein
MSAVLSWAGAFTRISGVMCRIRGPRGSNISNGADRF